MDPRPVPRAAGCRERGVASPERRVDPARDDERRVAWVMLLTATFLIAQAITGWLANSLALLADAGHMLSDTAALGLAWLSFRIGRRPADTRRSYGYYRFEILAAFVNGLALFAVAGFVCVEAVRRLRAPAPVLGGPMLVVAVFGLSVNVLAFAILRRSGGDNVTLRSALAHVLGDLLGSVAAIAAAVVILLTGWMPIDPLLSVFVALLILRSASEVVRRSGHVLMEGAPEGFDAGSLGDDLVAHVPGVRSVHHVHAWMINAERPMVTLHLELAAGADAATVLAAAKARLRDEFCFEHSTIQVDPADCPG
jgi:cobalt-zinc-cadmium efflux system protein